MSKLVLVNNNGPLNRSLYSLSCELVSNIPDEIVFRDTHFALFLALDARGVSDQEIGEMAHHLFAKGLCYICVWGTECERVHDIFDEVEIAEGWQISPDSVVMSTWHAGECLAEALWFFVNITEPDIAYELTCTAGLAVAVGNKEWALQISTWLKDLSALNHASDP